MITSNPGAAGHVDIFVYNSGNCINHVSHTVAAPAIFATVGSPSFLPNINFTLHSSGKRVHRLKYGRSLGSLIVTNKHCGTVPSPCLH